MPLVSEIVGPFPQAHAAQYGYQEDTGRYAAMRQVGEDDGPRRRNRSREVYCSLGNHVWKERCWTQLDERTMWWISEAADMSVSNKWLVVIPVMVPRRYGP